jgi:hypothetical protein
MNDQSTINDEVVRLLANNLLSSRETIAIELTGYQMVSADLINKNLLILRPDSESAKETVWVVSDLGARIDALEAEEARIAAELNEAYNLKLADDDGLKEFETSKPNYDFRAIRWEFEDGSALETYVNVKDMPLTVIAGSKGDARNSQAERFLRGIRLMQRRVKAVYLGAPRYLGAPL